jgi:hypothetical protein
MSKLVVETDLGSGAVHFNQGVPVYIYVSRCPRGRGFSLLTMARAN